MKVFIPFQFIGLCRSSISIKYWSYALESRKFIKYKSVINPIFPFNSEKSEMYKFTSKINKYKG